VREIFRLFKNPWFAAEAGKSTGGSPLDEQVVEIEIRGRARGSAVQRIDGTQCADKPDLRGKVEYRSVIYRANTWPLLSPRSGRK